MGDVFWNVATSYEALSILGLIWLAAVIVGYAPLIQYVPVIGPYVPVAKFVTLIVAALICFLIGFRIADERETTKNLRDKIAVQQADLDNARKSAADADTRAMQIEKAANDQSKADSDYIASLKPVAACGFDPGPSGVRPRLQRKWPFARSPGLAQ